MAALPKAMRNTSPLKKLTHFGEVFHFDIVYGKEMAISSYRYVLWLIDCTSRYVSQYPLKSLQDTELVHALRLFTLDIGGRLLQQMIADRDFKLIGGAAAEYPEGIDLDQISEDNIGQAYVSGVPARQQNQNGLLEIKWCHVMNMVCNWLTSNYLPKKF
eukprot:8652899-Ditylum_brightwellii.AAC.1